MKKICLLLTFILCLIFSLTSHAEIFSLVYEDGSTGKANIEYYQMTPAESQKLDYVITQWCKNNNPATTEYLIERATNYILRKAPYKNDGLKCFSPYGVLNGAAVCMGYSLFLQRILDKKGIPNELVYDRNRTHMYNLVDGKKVDITREGTLREAYSLIMDALDIAKQKLAQF